ncbi:MAG: flagellin [Pirellulaceae bacterium]
MSRINTNVPSLVAQNTLARSNAQLNLSLQRLSTGLRINTGKDDPAGLIASEYLRRDILSINTAVNNTNRASELIATTDSALSEVSKILLDVRSLVTEAANTGALSSDQIDANQLQVDSSLEAIDRISQTTTFQGRKLLDGSLDFVISATPSNVTQLKIEQANLGSTGSVTVDVDITSAASRAQVTTATTAFTANAITGDLVVRVTGKTGSEVFSFSSGATITQVVNAVNLVSDATGVTAANSSGALDLRSSDYGSEAFVSVEIISQDSSGTFATNVNRATGSDISALVNGVEANGRANTLSVNTATLDLSVTVSSGSTTDFSFDITGGGAVFQLGPNVVSNQQARIGIESVNSGSLGGTAGRLFELRSGGTAALKTNTTLAASIVDQTVTTVSKIRGRLGAFQRTTLESNIRALEDSASNLSSAESSIRDADFAKESSNITRAQILVQSGTSVLAIANQNPQQVLSLLR